MSHTGEKHKNKNIVPKLKNNVLWETDDELDYAIGTVEMIQIKREDDDPSSALMDIEVLVNTFKQYPIVFHAGDMRIHLKYDKKLRAKMIINLNTKMISLMELTDVCNIHKTFVILGTIGDKFYVLPKNAMTYFLFDKLRVSEGNMNLTVLVELRDLIPIYYKDRKDRMEYVPEYLQNSKSNIKKTGRQWNVLLSEERASDSLGIRQLDMSLKGHVKELRSSLKRVTLPSEVIILKKVTKPRRTQVFPHYPVDDELFKYPTQVSSDDRQQQRDEQVTSAGSSSIFSDNHSYAFGNSLNLFPHNSTLSSAASNRSTHPSRYVDYINHDKRLASYLRWPLDKPTPAELSTAGFFYTNQGDLVRCFQCGIGLKDFSEDDDPILEHVRHSGQCPVLPKLLGEETLATLKRQLQQVDPEFNRRMQLNGEVDPILRSGYRHPEYQSMQARLSSFTHWPQQLIQTPQRLAEAGLYYTGIEDQVRCFACDGGLRRWDPDDDPWTEHCRWFPACPYALEQKGEQYIALIQASVENERYGASGGEGHEDVTRAMERLRLRDSETDIVIKQHTPICRDMGFEDTELKEAVIELRDRGNATPSIEDIVDVIEVIRERKQSSIETESNVSETPFEENKRLKSHVFCMNCGKNKINALFLPCTHHRLCMSCAEPLHTCTICRRHIKEKIRTYMV